MIMKSGVPSRRNPLMALSWPTHTIASSGIHLEIVINKTSFPALTDGVFIWIECNILYTIHSQVF